jgi:hypothetical protein
MKIVTAKHLWKREPENTFLQAEELLNLIYTNNTYLIKNQKNSSEMKSFFIIK